MVYNKLVAAKCAECLALYEVLNMSLKSEENRRERLATSFFKDVFELSEKEIRDIFAEYWSYLGFSESYASRYMPFSLPYEERARREREEELAWEAAQKTA